MFKKILTAEWLKLRHSFIWIVLITLPIISVLFGNFNFYFNQGVLKNEWYSLWTQVSLFYGEFFLPILIAICCSYVCRLEHMNKNWNTIMTSPIPIKWIFISKLVIVTILLFTVQIFLIFLYFCSGKIMGLSSQIPIEILGWTLRGWLATITIASLQLGLSIRIRSFATPIGISICCVFMGLGMYLLKLGMFFPHSLLTIGMGVISQKGLNTFSMIQFLFMNAVFTILFSCLTIGRLKKVDVVA
ncbi:ABC transporter permease [Clostridium sediminicola]|uniref:ABC transporter permease n=1 Tax=Clostridium sediminicola TaxID=3114879 RepID=UPI0031F24AB6